ncbi:Os12g0247900 [Oryza sativa Japonica Group]|uniref:Os12g0247900 protein n=1 Tax=Oryza sativa subsp. japonica TaxID=39947 RepID=A0A0P0Y8M5_ORYSJ|nr:Os12g0247900 [Oryza sativa Japonica Group]
MYFPLRPKKPTILELFCAGTLKGVPSCRPNGPYVCLLVIKLIDVITVLPSYGPNVPETSLRNSELPNSIYIQRKRTTDHPMDLPCASLRHGQGK